MVWPICFLLLEEQSKVPEVVEIVGALHNNHNIYINRLIDDLKFIHLLY